jgi:hypothetical protein
MSDDLSLSNSLADLAARIRAEHEAAVGITVFVVGIIIIVVGVPWRHSVACDGDDAPAAVRRGQ